MTAQEHAVGVEDERADLTSESVISVTLVRSTPTEVFVSSLGRTSALVEQQATDRRLALDAMGAVLPLGIGLALGLEKTRVGVTVFDTDGSLMMEPGGISALATSRDRVPQLRLLVLDNGIYESGGGRSSRSYVLDWEYLFAAHQVSCQLVRTEAELLGWLDRPRTAVSVCVAKVHNPSPAPTPSTQLDGREKVSRFIDDVAKLNLRTRIARSTKT